MIIQNETRTASINHILAGAPRPVLKVIGLGGGGCNAVERMIELGLRGVDFIAANTDRQTLIANPAETKILLGPETTRGLGAGGDPRKGRAAAEESRDELTASLAGADMVFLTAGMGGGTGTGAIPVVAEIARSLDIVTIATVTSPFSFEMGRRLKNAQEGLEKLRQHTHTLISIPNDRLLFIAPKDMPLPMTFRLADDVLRQAVQGISELITEPGLINVDFAHIRRLMLLGGGALMSIGQGQGADKALQALEQAMHHPLLESVSLENAAGVIINFTGGDDLTLLEVQQALTSLQGWTGGGAEVVPGVVTDKRMQGRVQVILMVTGLGAHTLEETLPGFSRPQPLPEPVAEMESQPPQETSQPRLAMVGQNYDLPAFLRRRVR